MATSKIFDDYEVNCNECKNYWDSSCDGVPITKRRNCTSYIATRTVDIPKQIEKLKKSIKWLAIAVCLLGLGLLLQGIKL